MEEKVMDTVENIEEVKEAKDKDTFCPNCSNDVFDPVDDNKIECVNCKRIYAKSDLDLAMKMFEKPQKERPIYRYLIVEYCFKDNSTNGEKHILGSYPTIGEARLNAGIYIKDNAKRMKKRYRFWQVKVQREKVFFDINTRVH